MIICRVCVYERGWSEIESNIICIVDVTVVSIFLYSPILNILYIAILLDLGIWHIFCITPMTIIIHTRMTSGIFQKLTNRRQYV